MNHILKNKALIEKALKRHIKRPNVCLLTQICWPHQPRCQAQYIEQYFGIPPKLLSLIESLYVNLPSKEQPAWVAKLLEQVEDGADLSLIVNHFLVWLLTDPQKGIIIYATTPGLQTAIENVSSLHSRVISGGEVTGPEWDAAAGDAARAAAGAAAGAAAWAAVDAADAAAWAAAGAAVKAAWAAAGDAAWDAQREKLESLLQSCSGKR